MDAVSLTALIKSRKLSPVEAVEAALERIDRLDASLHAFCTLTPDLARAEAGRIEAEIMAGHDPGLLAGIPVGHKDLLMTRGARSTSGSLAYKDFVSEKDDIVVERMRAAGAVMLGKTNAAEFGYSPTGHNPVFETTRNPWNLALTSGGSSAGSAAAVAAGMCPLATGSDGGGSVRIPPSFCGLYETHSYPAADGDHVHRASLHAFDSHAGLRSTRVRRYTSPHRKLTPISATARMNRGEVGCHSSLPRNANRMVPGTMPIMLAQK